MGADGHPRVSFRVTNAGTRAGRDVPQVYLVPPGGVPRLVGWATVDLRPGQHRLVSVHADDPRTYARYRVDDPGWVVEAGTYRLRLARSASPEDVVAEADIELEERVQKP